MTPALAIDGVSHSYGARVALRDVSLEVLPGCFTALLGVNGAGKTTLFNLATRLFDTGTGRIAICGHDLRHASVKALSQLGVVFQSRALDLSLTVRQNLIYHGALHGIRRADALEKGQAQLARLGLGDRMGDRVATLSGGEVRRVEIACALLHGPSLLLCDEATVGLDVRSRARIVEDVHALAAEEGVGILWTTHLIDEIRPEDMVYVLHKGEIRASGLSRELAGEAALGDAFLALTSEDA